MLANQRQQKIRELIHFHHSIRISELSEMFKVSEMTIHRDIKPMVEEGLIEKTFGGISLVTQSSKIENTNDCVVCNRKIEHRFSCRLILSQNRVESTCCVHCGLLRLEMLGEQVIEILCSDFFTTATISAKNAWFVMDTAIDLSCCKPQLIIFNLKEHADGFVKGFGGKVYTFSQALQIVIGHSDGKESCCHCD
jgi:DeoR family transcriptional regulator, copper-sensing transcriptional repressor